MRTIAATLLHTFVLLGAITQPAHASAPLIAVDVGHSKSRPGATSARGATEFGFNLGLARSIADTLYARDVRVTLIGDDGNMNSLPARTATAQARKSTFLLSVHHDSVQPHYLEPWSYRGMARLYSNKFAGYSLFVSRKNAQADISLACAREIGAAMQHAGFAASTHHAEPIEGENREWADEKAGVYWFDDLVVLKSSATPAVLLEAGILVNRDEEETLQDPKTRQRIATAVADGLAACGALPRH